MTVATDPRKTGVNAGMTLLAASAVQASHTGDTIETALATITIPGGAMGTNGGLLIYATWSYTNSANIKTLRTRLGGLAGTIFGSLPPTTTASIQDFRRIRNRGNASSQVGGSATAVSLTASTGSPATGTVDTSVNQDLVLSAQLALGSETINLDSYEVWLLP